MAATMIQSRVLAEPVISPMRAPQVAVSTHTLAAVAAAALVVALFVAMLPGLAGVPVGAERPRGLDAPSVSNVIERSSGPSIVVSAPMPQPGIHP